MKKITLAFAAIAMIAFAGCNKEENTGFVADENGMVTINLTAETYGFANKQAYYGHDQYIEFQYGDACYANGYNTTLDLLSEDGSLSILETADAHSRLARISVPQEYMSLPFTVLYPANSYTAGAEADFPAWNVPMAPRVEWIVEDLDVSVRASVEPGVTSNWPMAATITEGGRGSFQLRNAIAVVSPSVKFGTAFLQGLAEKTGSPYTYDEDHLPSVYIDSVVLTSNVALSGNGHVVFDATNIPTLVMDAPVATTDNQLIIVPNIVDEYKHFEVDAGIEHIFGNATVAPMHAGDQLQMTVYFTLKNGSNYHCVYNGNNVTLTETPEQFSILRGCRTTLCMNLFGRSYANRVNILSVD